MGRNSKDYLGFATALFVCSLPLFVIIRNLDQDTVQQQTPVFEEHESARLISTGGPCCEQLTFINDDVCLFSLSCSQIEIDGLSSRFEVEYRSYGSHESITESFADRISIGKRIRQLKTQFYERLKVDGWVEDDQSFMNPYHPSKQGWSVWRRQVQ